MSLIRIKPALLLAAAASLGLLISACEQAPGKAGGKMLEKPALANELIQQFPTNDAMKTAWKVHWATSTGSGLYIQDAFFKKGPKEPWLQVLGDLRLSEMFVPYHSGSPRFWDVAYNFQLCPVTR